MQHRTRRSVTVVDDLILHEITIYLGLVTRLIDPAEQAIRHKVFKNKGTIAISNAFFLPIDRIEFWRSFLFFGALSIPRNVTFNIL